MNILNFTKTYWTLDISQIEILFSILIFAATTILGAVIFSRDTKNWTNRFFILLATVFELYIVANYFSLHPPTLEDRLFWIRAVMFSASFKTPLLFLLVYNFPKKELVMPKSYLFATLIIMGLSAAASLGSYVFKDIVYINNQPSPVSGPAMPLFVANFAGFLILSFIILTKRYVKYTGDEKSQQLFLLVGILLSFSLILVFSFLFVVVLEQSSFVFLGPASLFFLLGFIAYSMVKHKLFAIKIVAANVLVAAILIVLFAKVFVAKSIIEIIIDAIIFILVLVFGTLLIKSIRKEVEQREKLEILTQELEAANVKLKELNKVKSEFLSFASHQVKAPMAAVKGYATLILDGTYGQVPDKIKEISTKIKETADRMISLVNNLLDLRKIEEGKMSFKFEKTDIVKMISDITQELKPLAQNKGLDLSFESLAGSLVCNVDSEKLWQVFQNLIDNSIKYTDRGWIKVKLEVKNGVAEITVADSGRGISKELLPQLFEQFIRDTKEIKRIEGTGLGLYIARQIVEAHKGRIWVESSGEGQGSVFYVTLPV